MSLRPTPQQERWLRIAARKTLPRDTARLAERTGGWTAATLLTRCAFFILGVVASVLLAAILELLHVPVALLVAGLILVAGAEWLIMRRRLFGAGIEEALELAGLAMIAFQAFDLFNPAAEARISLLAAMVLIAAGARLLNPLFMMLGIAALSLAVNFAALRNSIAPSRAATAAGVFCLVAACVALYVHGRQFRRPAYDAMQSWLLIMMPLAAYLWLAGRQPAGPSMASLQHAPVIALLPCLSLLTFGLVALFVGIRRRAHAPIIAFMICGACVAFELRNLTRLTLASKLIFWGTVVLLLLLGLNKYLRTPRAGITSSPFAERQGSLDLLQLAASSALAPQSVQPAGSPFRGGGGVGGGGGASGNY